jgi:hypothetical protein
MMGTRRGGARGLGLMPIARLLAGRAFTDEQTRELVYAYERLLATLNLTDRADPICEHVARTVIECAADDFDCTSVYDLALSKLTPGSAT